MSLGDQEAAHTGEGESVDVGAGVGVDVDEYDVILSPSRSPRYLVLMSLQHGCYFQW